MSRELNDTEVAAITIFLSVERLTAYTQLTGSNREAIALHQQVLQVGTCLMAVIAVVEIALRNAVCERMSQHFGSPDWLRNPPAPFSWRRSEGVKVIDAEKSARRAAYSKLSQAEKHALDALAFPAGRPPNLSHSDRAKARQAQIPVSNGKVIAEVTMYFWKRLFSEDYEEALWKTSLRRVFPNKKLRRADVALQLERIYQARNRLAHHEPVYGRRLTETLTAIEFVAANLGGAYAPGESPLAKLLEDDMQRVNEQATALATRFASFSGTTDSYS
jgi:hypothetical protein